MTAWIISYVDWMTVRYLPFNPFHRVKKGIADPQSVKITILTAKSKRGTPNPYFADPERVCMLNPPYSAVILAGGKAQRLGGGDKPLRLLGGKPILQWMIERIQPQIQFLAISANGDPARFSAYDLPILPDQTPGLGPMSGILASLEWTKRTMPNASHVLTLSGDTPFIPLDVVHRLSRLPDIGASDIVTASSGGHRHPTIGFWPVSAIEPIKPALFAHKNLRVSDWLSILIAHTVEWDARPFDPFFNINTPDDLEEAERRILQ